MIVIIIPSKHFDPSTFDMSSMLARMRMDVGNRRRLLPVAAVLAIVKVLLCLRQLVRFQV
jgi:hypothetical protein